MVSSTLTPLEHTAIGAFAGMTEVSIMQPTVAIKNALQEGRPVPRSPLALYRGLGMNMGAMLPITASQFGMNRLLEQTFKRVLGREELDNGARIGVAMGAGSFSAIFGCPAEFVVIQQQKSGRSLPAELRHIVSTYGIMKLYKGMTPTIARESLYAAGYLGVCPILREALEQQPSVSSMPGGPIIISGITAGVLASVCTQPQDTVKTRMQAFPDASSHPQYSTALSTARHILQTEGAATFFAGLVPRCLRITAAVFILTGTRNFVIGAVQERRASAAAAPAVVMDT